MTMNNQTPVISMAADYEEIILRLAKHLGRDKNRREVFNLIYGRGSKPRSKKQIADLLGKVGNTQVIQNVLDELQKYKLIVRIENNGFVKDGSRWVYGKDESVRAHRAEIIKYADDPRAAKKVVTKRPVASTTKLLFVKPAARTERTRRPASRSRAKQARLKIAVLMTNPEMRASLQTALEARDIEESLRAEIKAGTVDVKFVPAPTLDNLINTLNSYRPDVIHFSGHGGSRSLLFDNERAGDDGGTVLDFDMVARVVGATSSSPKLLVLVACDTADGAERFLDEVPMVIAMADAIDDEAACEFSKRFYRSIGDSETVANSLKQAKLVLEAKGYKDAKLPTLLAKDDKVAHGSLL